MYASNNIGSDCASGVSACLVKCFLRVYEKAMLCFKDGVLCFV